MTKLTGTPDEIPVSLRLGCPQLSDNQVLGDMSEVMHRLARSYAGRPILVTGGASFIGSHLSELLVQSGGNVTVADDLSSGKRENLDAISSNINFLKGDLRHTD